MQCQSWDSSLAQGRKSGVPSSWKISRSTLGLPPRDEKLRALEMFTQRVGHGFDEPLHVVAEAVFQHASLQVHAAQERHLIELVLSRREVSDDVTVVDGV